MSLIGAGVVAARDPLPSPLAITVCLALITSGVRFRVLTRLGSQRLELTWIEAGIILAFSVVPAPWVVLLTAVAVGGNLAQRRFAPVKIVYNIGSSTLASSAAAGLLLLSDTAPPFIGLELLVLTAAGAIAVIVTHIAVPAVVSVVQDTSFLTAWRASAGLQLLTVAGNLAVAVGVLTLARYASWAVLALPVAAVFVHQVYVGRVRGHQERVTGQQHASAVGRLIKDLDEPGVIQRAAEDACALADVHFVEVELPAQGEIPSVLHRHFRRNILQVRPPGQASGLKARVVGEFPIQVDHDAAPGYLRAWLIGGAPGLPLDKSKQDALRSLAEHAGAAVRNARIHALQTYLATHDRLTGLPIRALLVNEIERVARDGGAGGDADPAAVLMIDVTGYREIVRTLGHDVAEDLLARTARRLEAAAEDGEYVAHVGADDFGVHLPRAVSPAHVRSRALALLAAIAEPIQLDNSDLVTTRITLTAAAGAAYSSTPVGSGIELLRQASVALDQARATNIALDFYDPAIDELDGPAAVVLTSELHAALDDDQLVLHYQPIVHLPSGAPVAMEALLRWYHPTKGMLQAGEFMTMLERSPDHPRFVAWQLERALHTRQEWGPRDLPVSINVAARCLLDRRFPEEVSAALVRVGVPGDQLMLEIDETAVLTQPGLVGNVLTELRLLGVRVAIDGLGTGTSSLIGLLTVPATHVKVDGLFVRRMLVDPEAMAVVGLALDLCRRSGLEFVATGVTSDGLVDALRERGCDLAQGPHLMRALVPDELRTYLASVPAEPTVPAGSVVALDSWRRNPV